MLKSGTLCAVGLLQRLERLSISRNNLNSLPSTLGNLLNVQYSEYHMLFESVCELGFRASVRITLVLFALRTL